MFKLRRIIQHQNTLMRLKMRNSGCNSINAFIVIYEPIFREFVDLIIYFQLDVIISKTGSEIMFKFLCRTAANISKNAESEIFS